VGLAPPRGDERGDGRRGVSAGPSEPARAPAPKVFISYRRQDTAAHAGRLYDAMVPRFGESNVFMDVDLEPGIDFVERITEAVAGCHVLIVIMGPRWATLEDADGVVRIADSEDFVRLEVVTALQRSDVTVIPVLVSGAQMPDPDELPQEVRAITRRNALELSDTRWRYDVGRLTDTLDELLAEMTGTHQIDVPAGELPSPVQAGAGPAAPAPGAARTRRRLLAGVLALAAAGAVAALGVVVLGGGSSGSGDGGVGSEGIQFEPFTGAGAFTVDVPVGWHAITVEEQLAAVKRTEFQSPNGKLNVHILQEPESPPADRAKTALEAASAEPGFRFIHEEAHTFGNRQTELFEYEIDREGLGPATIVNYALNAGGFGWRTRVSVPKSDTSLAVANEIATQAAKTLKPR
jgi:TIR domain-containing protein